MERVEREKRRGGVAAEKTSEDYRHSRKRWRKKNEFCQESLSLEDETETAGGSGSNRNADPLQQQQQQQACSAPAQRDAPLALGPQDRQHSERVQRSVYLLLHSSSSSLAPLAPRTKKQD
ncbi:hypothetical protein KOW79_017899 [Hemibagrus wyckioides]|uniref:Uncharacterized protein n=1 Tax=Hemibagrus wyckioides TaxID=337641 RepID=A0A9D3N922_9TELE|nr:hypothetical protein KOW79_017899 [Hemibagrus wyckioides]